MGHQNLDGCPYPACICQTSSKKKPLLEGQRRLETLQNSPMFYSYPHNVWKQPFLLVYCPSRQKAQENPTDHGHKISSDRQFLSLGRIILIGVHLLRRMLVLSTIASWLSGLIGSIWLLFRCMSLGWWGFCWRRGLWLWRWPWFGHDGFAEPTRQSSGTNVRYIQLFQRGFSQVKNTNLPVKCFSLLLYVRNKEDGISMLR